MERGSPLYFIMVLAGAYTPWKEILFTGWRLMAISVPRIRTKHTFISSPSA